MKKTTKSAKQIKLTLTPENNDRLSNLCGQYNQNLKKIEDYFAVEIRARGNEFQILGSTKNIEQAKEVLKNLYKQTANGNFLNPEQVHLLLSGTKAKSSGTPAQTTTATKITLTTPKTLISPHTQNQLNYVKNIQQYDINFGIGPAGTGKTYLAVACAVEALVKEQVDRIILVRPAVEAGEHLGFLPGDISQKVDPYLRPLYDALYNMLGALQVEKLIADRVIEIAPLAFMRGRTLNAAFVILDESQNTTPEQMKMFLTRIGFNSKAVVTGDITQIDLANGKQSGLVNATQILKNIKGISFSYFNPSDVVRHPLVQLIIQAYEKAKTKRKAKPQNNSTNPQ